MSAEEPDPPLRDFSPITAVARGLFAFAKWLSPMQWLGWVGRRPDSTSYFHLFRPRSDLTPAECGSKEFTRHRARAIEMYMVAWLVFELFAVSTVCLGLWQKWFVCIIAVLIGSRIIEIIQVTVNATLFDALSGRPDERVASRARMLVLAAVNFIELLLCFGVIYATDYLALRGAGRPVTAFYFSIITQLTIGYGDVYPTGWLRVVAAMQGLVGILFVILVFGRFMASLPQLRGIFEEKRH